MLESVNHANHAGLSFCKRSLGRWAEPGSLCCADLFSHLDSGFLQGVVNYEVSRTTLADVFLKLEDEEAIDHEGKTLIPLCKFGMIKVLYSVFSLKKVYVNFC